MNDLNHSETATMKPHSPTHNGDSTHAAPAANNAHDEIPTDLPKIGNLGVIIAAVVVAACFLGLFFVGWLPHQKREAELDKDQSAQESSRPMVQVAAPQRTRTGTDIVLPADARAMQETSIFPRANGYLKSLKVDIGDTVKAGQLLAEIDAPDIDAELAQASAAVVQAQAEKTKANNDFELTQATFKRYEAFAKSGGVTQQQLEEKQSALTQAQSALAGAEASIKAADANVQRLTALQGFEKVYAPFAGTITARNYDLGALMSAGGGGKELFRIADTSTLRLFVNVPQTYITSLQTGQDAFLSVRNFPGKEFKGKIVRSAGALDPSTRTLRYQIDVPNEDGVLFAGMYATARLQVNDAKPPLVVPTSALVFDSAGSKVWVVKDGKTYPQKVGLGRDLGVETEVESGLSGGESIVTNPGQRLAEGVDVELTANGKTQQATAPATQPVLQHASAR